MLRSPSLQQWALANCISFRLVEWFSPGRLQHGIEMMLCAYSVPRYDASKFEAVPQQLVIGFVYYRPLFASVSNHFVNCLRVGANPKQLWHTTDVDKFQTWNGECVNGIDGATLWIFWGGQLVIFELWDVSVCVCVCKTLLRCCYERKMVQPRDETKWWVLSCPHMA